jgi:polysulfide reductase chain C
MLAVAGKSRPMKGTDFRGEASTRTLPVLPQDLLVRIPVKPQATAPQRVWGLAIAGYLYLAAMGAGAFIVAVILDWFGLRMAATYVNLVGGWAWDWSKALVLWGPLLAAVGASFLLLHLGRNWFLFPTAWRNLRSSWLARGFVILSMFIVVGTTYAAAAIFLPHWLNRFPALLRVAQAAGLVLAIGTAVYTSVVLKSEKYFPAWTELAAPFLFLAFSLSTGVGGLLVGAAAYGALAAEPASADVIVSVLESSMVGLVVIEAALLVVYVRRLRGGGPEAQMSATMLLSGSWSRAFWAGIVGGALVVPFVLGVFDLAVGSDRLPADLLTVAAAVGLLVGGFLLRLGILAVGVRQAPPLYRLSRWRAKCSVEPNTPERLAGRQEQ